MAADLRATQRRFYELVTAPEGVEQGLRSLGLDVTDLAQLVCASDTMTAVERLDVYAEMYFYRLRDVLKDEFPNVVAALGDDTFSNLVTDYLLAHRPRHASLREAGAALPLFIATHGVSRERPWLADLAALERARLEVFDAADDSLLEIAHLQAMSPEQFASLPIHLVAAHAVVESRFAVDRRWAAPGEDPKTTAPPRADTTLLVWREPSGVYHRPLDDDERALLPMMQSGVPFGRLCDRLTNGRTVDEATPLAAALLARWTMDRLIAR